MGSEDHRAEPPAFVRLASHPLRWALLTALAEGGDQRVRELVARVGEPQNLVSYHLRLLREGGLVSTRRSTFDGRDTYYHLDLERCAGALAGTGAALHPMLRMDRAPVVPPRGRRTRRPSVLFVCTGNSARSPIAEALMRHHATDDVTATSAGVVPKDRLHPHTVRVLADAFGIDVRGQQPRKVDTLVRRRFDHVVTLCDKARESCPELRHAPRRLHWSLPDPATSGYAAFERVAADIDTRVRHLLPVLTATDH